MAASENARNVARRKLEAKRDETLQQINTLEDSFFEESTLLSADEFVRHPKHQEIQQLRRKYNELCEMLAMFFIPEPSPEEPPAEEVPLY